MLLTNNERAEEVVEGCVCFVPNCCCVVSHEWVITYLDIPGFGGTNRYSSPHS